ncbi:OLC1v1018878C1 [Oldenlandia corymbosa var. corymbosa]|uniref:OLC1v1018878C1 n=1 Tax=Oldenlandia corymbosa var. corymbosa TaxID=529605 RepID=A0AAV1ECP6_OLDCO|nr:OLC1v1018878C1 [Oldenlandia corymbosa var. corymbosa]
MAKGIAAKFNVIILVALFIGFAQPTKSNDSKEEKITQAINELKLAVDKLNSVSFDQENSDGILKLQSALMGLIHTLESKGSATEYSDVDGDIKNVIKSFKSFREAAPESLGAVRAFPPPIVPTIGDIINKIVNILSSLT